MAMSVFMFHGFIRGSIPLALEEAAYIDGCTHTQTFFRIVFPLLKPIISTMVIMNAMAFWNDFLLPSLVLTDKKLLTTASTELTLQITEPSWQVFCSASSRS